MVILSIRLTGETTHGDHTDAIRSNPGSCACSLTDVVVP